MGVKNINGQTLVEFVACSFIATLIAVSGAFLIQMTWQRSRCIHLVFEQTHAALIGIHMPNLKVQITEDANWVVGESNCGIGNIIARVKLPKLDKAQ